jgi:hypothetical protein
MNKYYKQLLQYAAKDKNTTQKEILKLWNCELPHFGGGMPHRMQDHASEFIKISKKNDFVVCRYCLKPENWIGEK